MTLFKRLLLRAFRRLDQAAFVRAAIREAVPTRARRLAPGVIVALTTFPPRVGVAALALQSLALQTVRPERILLVLSEDEFPTRRVPRSLRPLPDGVEVYWVMGNLRSYKKLLPVVAAYPDAVVITVDDDAFYEATVVEELLAASKRHADAIIGHRGREVIVQDRAIAPYLSWPHATPETDPRRLFLTSGGGTLYPPGLLDTRILLDTERAQRLSPWADDVWVWAVTTVSGVSMRCISSRKRYRPLLVRSGTPELFVVNGPGGENDRQIAAVVRDLGLIVTDEGIVARPTTVSEG